MEIIANAKNAKIGAKSKTTKKMRTKIICSKSVSNSTLLTIQILNKLRARSVDYQGLPAPRIAKYNNGQFKHDIIHRVFQ